MPSNDNLSGVWSALPTPFKEDRRLDMDAFTSLLEHQLEGGVRGVVVSGTTGESPTLTVQEKISLIRKAKAVGGPKLRVMAGTGGNNTDASVELSRLAADAGADSLLIVTPPYNKPSLQGLKAHFTAIAESTPLPICLYHVPSRTGQFLSKADIVELCKIPQITAVKEASGDLRYFSEAQMESEARFLSGDDFTFLPSLAVGGEGIVSVASNVFPKEMVELYEAFRAGNFNLAKTLHRVLMPFFSCLFLDSNPSPVKAVLTEMGIGTDRVRLPLASVNEADRDKILRTFREVRDQLENLGRS